MPEPASAPPQRQPSKPTSPKPKPTPPAPKVKPKTASAPSKKGRPVTLAIVMGIVLCLALGVLAVTLALRSSLFRHGSAGIPLDVTRVSSSPLATPASPSAPPVVEVGNTRVLLAVPTELQVGAQSFAVQPADSTADTSPSIPAVADTASWVYGTVVNYVLGLQDTGENRDMLSQLEEGDSLMLRLANGTQLMFVFSRLEEVAADDADIMSQYRPGLTLVLVSDEEGNRLVAFADFDRADEPTPLPGETAAATGQPVQVGDARVVVEEGYGVADNALPGGTMAYLVEFGVQNTGSDDLDTALFATELVDAIGNRYLPAPDIARYGSYGPLEGHIAPGETVSGTAGYLVPAGLAGPDLTWIFAPQANAELRARFVVTYTPPVVAPVLPDVEVFDAFLAEDGEILHILADIYNPGTVALEVTEDDISLSSSEGQGELIATAPLLPWTIAADDEREMELEFACPDASTAIVTILGYTFEISGLP